MKKIFIFLLTLFFVQFAVAQSINVTGIVTDAGDNSTLPSVTVQVKGTTNGTITDIDGNFAITANQGDVLVFSLTGYKNIERTVASDRLNVALASDTEILDEVVAVGYGTMKKSDITGAVASIKADELKKNPAANFSQALQGQAAGVTVNANSGQPGASAQVRIRGIGTLNNANPIYVVDGIIVENIDFLNANDIERTEVLKDASAAAIYGARGANGVILVTTKTGKEQKGKISFDAYFGIQSRWRKLDVMKAYEFAQTLAEINEVPSEINVFNKSFLTWLQAYRLGSSEYYPNGTSWPTKYTAFDYSKQETDWQDEVFVPNAPIQSYNLSFTGGNEKHKYALSAGYFDQKGTLIGSYYKRFTIRANTSYKIREWLNVGETMTYMYSTWRNTPGNLLYSALGMAPWDPTHYPAGSVNRKGEDIGGRPAAASNFRNIYNPFSMVETRHPMDNTNRVIGNVFVELTPVKDLTIRSSVSMDFSLVSERSFGEAYNYSTYDHMDKNFVSSSLRRYIDLIVENIVTYSKTIGKHSFSIMGGQTTQQWSMYGMGLSGSTILNPVPENWYISQATADFPLKPGDDVDRVRMLSFLGRVNYNYGDRYLLTVNFRADGSSKFPRNTWGYFPSVAVGWRITGENFMKNQKVFNDLKLRFGWGQLGNQSSAGSADFLQTINSSMYFSTYILGQGTAAVDYNTGSVVDGQTPAQGASVLTRVDEDGKWETTETYNLALDFAMLKSKFTGTLEFFRRDTRDMFLFVAAPAYTGNPFPPKKNIGTVRNDGIELTLNWQETRNKVTYAIGGNASFIKNELIKMNGGERVYGDRVVSDEGLALFTYYGYEYLGLYQTQDEIDNALYNTPPRTYQIGDAKYRDVDDDGKIDDNDRLALGNPFPWLSYGLNASIEYFGFDFQLFLQGVYGNEVYNALRHNLEGPGNQTVMSTDMRDCWTNANPNGSIPHPRNAVNFFTSSRFIENGAYLRLKNIQLGYTLPSKITTKAKIDRLRFYVSASNLFTITKYTGYDPEVRDGVDYGNYPQSRTFMFGVNMDF